MTASSFCGTGGAAPCRVIRRSRPCSTGATTCFPRTNNDLAPAVRLRRPFDASRCHSGRSRTAKPMRRAVADTVESLVNEIAYPDVRVRRDRPYYRVLDTTSQSMRRPSLRTPARAQALVAAACASTMPDLFAVEARQERAAFGNREVSAYEPHMGNIRAALEWSFSEGGEAQIGVQLAAGAAPLFLGFSLLGECEHWCERSLVRLAGRRSRHGCGNWRCKQRWRSHRCSCVVTATPCRKAIERGIGLAEALR